jgi:hypothetical protein
MVFDRRTRRLGAATLIAGALGAVALTAAFPSVAKGAVVAVTTVSCSVTGSNWCISGNDTSSGIGVIGTSKTGTGLRGTSTSQYGLKATSGSNYAILAQSTTGKAAISASTTSGYGVYGFTTSGGIGLYGSSSDGYGVYGTTTSGSGYGLVGLESGSGTGLYGSTASGNGLYGFASGTGTGATITANTGSALIARSAGGPTVYARNSKGNATDVEGSYIALLGRTPSGGFPIVATDPSGNNLFYVDGAGNVSYKGGLFHFAAIGRGLSVKSFSADTTEPTVEDTGTAQLVNGVGTVRLDPTFAGSIESGKSYRVFVTPNGDTRGLFVATKTPGGFIVREAQSGRSTVTFDYRIVATALGRAGQRMALTSDAAGAKSAPNAALSVVPAADATARLQAAPALPTTP